MERFAPHLEQLDGKKGDLLIIGTNKIVELKTDRYDHDKYNNFIMERFSYEDKPGGVWQAKKNKVKYLVYWFVNNDKMYIFDVVRLYYRMKRLSKKYKLLEKHNANHITRYYKIPREEFADLFLDESVLKCSKRGKQKGRKNANR